MLAAIWTFLNTPLGESLIGELVGLLFHQLVPDNSRRTQVLAYANDAFRVVEALAAAEPSLRGIDKYKVFVEAIVDRLKASGAPELSGPEMAMLQHLAQVKAMLAKPAQKPPAAP
jgi:hypothetical protein